MRRRAALAVLALLVLGGMGPAAVTPDPGLRYSVSGLGPLSLRVAPEASAGQAGDLRPGAGDLILTGRRAAGPEGDLWEVLAPDGPPAWALASRLAPGARDPASFPLQCSGTEPFWGLKLIGGRALMSRPGIADRSLRAGARQAAAGDPRIFVQRLSGGGQVVILRRPQGCSDGMSDLASPYEAVVTTPSGEVLGGCCRRAGG